MTRKRLLLPIIMKEKLIILKKDFLCFLFVWILSTLCVTASSQCPTVISNGTLSAGCTAVVGSICSFSCNAGYTRNTSVSVLTCKISRQWSSDLRSLCLREEKDGDKVCPDRFQGGYVSWLCSRIPHESCTYECSKGYLVNSTITQLTCKENGLWDADTNSLCIESGESSFFVPTSTGGRHESLVLGISVGTVILMTIIVIIVGCVQWCHLRKVRRRVPGQADSRYFGSREYPGQHVTSTRQYPASDGVSSFEPASYNRQQIPTISSSFKYPEPPPLYCEIPIAPNEAPPTYKEVVTDPSRFNLDIDLAVFNGQH